MPPGCSITGFTTAPLPASLAAGLGRAILFLDSRRAARNWTGQRRRIRELRRGRQAPAHRRPDCGQARAIRDRPSRYEARLLNFAPIKGRLLGGLCACGYMSDAISGMTLHQCVNDAGLCRLPNGSAMKSPSFDHLSLRSFDQRGNLRFGFFLC